MPAFNILNLHENVEEWILVGRMINHLRETFAAVGGRPEDFPKYLRDSGVRVTNQFVEVDDDFMTMAMIKFIK